MEIYWDLILSDKNIKSHQVPVSW